MPESIVDIHVPARSAGIPEGPYIDEGLSKWGRPELALALADRGVEPTFSRGPSAYDFESGSATILRPRITQGEDGYAVTVESATLPIDAVGAIRNITKVVGNGAPELNQPVVRATAKDKVATNDILATLGLAKDYAAWDADTDSAAALDEIAADCVVLKPRTGMRSRNIQIGSKAMIEAFMKDGDLEGINDWIVEEAVTFDAPLPVRGLDAQEQEKIDLVNNRRLPKELRAYSFGRDGQGNLMTSYVLRAAQLVDTHLSDDKWVFLDQESVPETIVEQTDEVVAAFEQNTGVREMHVAVDWGLVNRQNDSSPLWLPTEVNGTEPQLIYAHNHPLVAAEQAGKLADQLYRIAQNRSTL